MRFPYLFSITLFLALVGYPSEASAQGQTAMPFLFISPTPDGNGRGNSATAIVSDNPIATISNPAQLGYFSLANYVAASSYITKTDWLPAFNQSDLTYNAWGLSSGFNIRQVLPLPFSFSFGIGYSKIDLNLGTFIRTGSGGPDPIGTYDAYEKARTISLGFGAEYYIRVGIGWNFRKAESQISGISAPPPMGSGEPLHAEVSTTDFGVLAQVPFADLVRVVRPDTLLFPYNVQPLFDLTFGYSIANRGDDAVSYLAGVSDPLPRHGIAGMSLEMGVMKTIAGERWRMLTFSIVREADQVLVERYSDGSFAYMAGLGEISFFRNVIGGKADTNCVNSRKGWELNFFEFVTIRGGSYAELPQCGNRNYSTSGYAIRLRGLVRLLDAVAPGSTSTLFMDFVSRHLDIVYDHAGYSGQSLLAGTEFDSLNLIIR